MRARARSNDRPKGWRAVAISLAAHGLLAVALLTVSPARARPAALAPAPLEVTLEHLALPASEAAPAPVAAAPAAAHGEPVAMSTGRRATAPRPAAPAASVEPSGGGGGGGGRGDDWMRMRGGEGEPGPAPSGELPAGRGRGRGQPGALDLARVVAAEGPADPAGRLFPGPGDGGGGGPVLIPDGGGRYRHERETFTAHVARDGRVTFADKPNLQSDGVTFGQSGAVGFGGKFDLTDWAMRRMGEDPYRYEKALFLEQTRELREHMAEEERTELLREALHDLPEYLAKIWSTRRWTPAERRRILFQLWDDCAEAGRDDVVRAAAQARATIVEFVRELLPRGSADAYTDAELEELNASRGSSARFEPY